MDHEPRWFKAWTAPTGEPLDTEGVAWIRSRPTLVRHIMARHFPPSCVVRRNGSLWITHSFFENGDMRIRSSPQALVTELVARDETSNMVVVGCWRGLTCEKVRELLDPDDPASEPCANEANVGGAR